MPTSFDFNAWLHNGGPRRLPAYFCFWLTLIGLGCDLSIVGSIQASAQWQTYFNNPTGSKLGFLNAIATLGMVVGSPFAAYVAGPLGRKKGLLVGATIGIIASALQTGSVNISMYMAARFFVGFGYAIAHCSSPPYLSEMAPDSERTLAMGAYIPFYSIGAIMMSWTVYGTVNNPTSWSWRGPSILQMAPSVFQLMLLPFIPESPRWLAMKGRTEEAGAVLIKYHGKGEETEQVQDSMKAIELSIQQAKDEGSWADMVSTNSYRIRFFIVVVAATFSQWSGNSLISYYITTILNGVGYTDAKTQTLFNAVTTVWGLVWGFATGPMAQKFGRRPVAITGALTMLTSFCIFTGATAGYQSTQSKPLGQLVLGMIVIFNTGYSMCWSAIAFYSTELWPTRLRSKAQSLSSFFDYLALFIGIYVNPIAMYSIGWKYFFLFIALLVLENLFFFFFYVETNKHSIEDISDYWDGQMGEPKWLGGPGSYKMMNENAKLSAEKRATARLEESYTTVTGEKDSDVKVGSNVTVLPAL